jgi:hypothetical protein
MAELFDDITRIVGSQIPRRKALRLIAGAAVGGATVSFWPRIAEAQGGGSCPDLFGVIGHDTSGNPTSACIGATVDALQKAKNRCGPSPCMFGGCDSGACNVRHLGSGEYRAIAAHNCRCTCSTIRCGNHCCKEGEQCINGRCNPSRMRPQTGRVDPMRQS